MVLCIEILAWFFTFASYGSAFFPQVVVTEFLSSRYLSSLRCVFNFLIIKDSMNFAYTADAFFLCLFSICSLKQSISLLYLPLMINIHNIFFSPFSPRIHQFRKFLILPVMIGFKYVFSNVRNFIQSKSEIAVFVEVLEFSPIFPKLTFEIKFS